MKRIIFLQRLIKNNINNNNKSCVITILLSSIQRRHCSSSSKIHYYYDVDLLNHNNNNNKFIISNNYNIYSQQQQHRIHGNKRQFVTYSSTSSSGQQQKHNQQPKHNQQQSSLLKTKWPELVKQFNKLVQNNIDNRFPLLTRKQQMEVSRNVSFIRGNTKKAAVLVLLISVDGQPSLLFTRRAAHLSQHAAEISFPGGHYENIHDQVFPVDTAIRETVEELYNDDDNHDSIIKQQQQHIQQFKNDISILGYCTTLPSIRGVPVTPVIGVILDSQFTNPITDIWCGNKSEVDLVFTIPIHELLNIETTHILPSTRFNRTSHKAPIYPTKYNNSKIWGLTAYILHPLLHKLLKPVLFSPK